MSAPNSAPTRAACFVYFTSYESAIFGPRVYIIATSGIPHSVHLPETAPRHRSISGSVFAPRLTWMDTPSAPILIASSTVQTITFSFGSSPSVVLALRWMMRPMSRPWRRWPEPTAPLWAMMALAPPSTTICTAFFISCRPGMGPTVVPWSMGIMTVRPEPRSTNRSVLTSLPSTLGPPESVLVGASARPPRNRSPEQSNQYTLPGRVWQAPGGAAPFSPVPVPR